MTEQNSSLVNSGGTREMRGIPGIPGMPGGPDLNCRGLIGETVLYEIRVKCHLPARWSELFEGLTVTNLENGEALLCGPLADQSALLGVLERLSDLNVPLISVNPQQR